MQQNFGQRRGVRAAGKDRADCSCGLACGPVHHDGARTRVEGQKRSKQPKRVIRCTSLRVQDLVRYELAELVQVREERARLLLTGNRSFFEEKMTPTCVLTAFPGSAPVKGLIVITLPLVGQRTTKAERR